MRALFLDRDGVINHDMGYTHRWEDFAFIDGIFDLCRYAKGNGFSLFVVTNQAGIARGLYTEDDFHVLTVRMCAEFRERGAPIDKVYFSPFHPEHGIGRYRQDSFLRKPNPGMILLAAEEFGLSLVDCVLIGDRMSDIEAGHGAGIGCNLLFAPEGVQADARGSAACTPMATITRLDQAKDYLGWMTLDSRPW